jgi:2-(1,2-epoxy-1,2-dihydrophenyl)acetyl-CoA isomerase
MLSFKPGITPFKAVRRLGILFNKRSVSNASRQGAESGFSPLPVPDRQAVVDNEPVLGSEVVQAVQEKGILTIFLNRPAVLNAIDLEMAHGLRDQLKRATADPSVRVLVITGRGRTFCAGGDLTFALQANPEQPGDSFLALTTILHESIRLICTMPKPIIAAINGPAAGAGLFLALACDLRLMAHSAYLKVSNTSYGLSLPAGGSFLLPRFVGLARALEMAVLDTPIAAQEARGMGLVTSVVADDVLGAETEALAGRVAGRAVHTFGQVKQLLYASSGRSLPPQLAAEQGAIVQSANHPEGREGLAAFVQKRLPVFENISPEE